jgi:signal transduction histidine kinase/ActR/RegA family two-component response regulator
VLDDLLTRFRRASYGALLLIGALAVMGMGRLYDLTEEAGRNAAAIDLVLREVDSTRSSVADCYIWNRARKAGHQERLTEIRNSLDGRSQGQLKSNLFDILDEAGDDATLVGNTIESCETARSRLVASIRRLTNLPSQAAHTMTERRATQNVESAANRHIAMLRKLAGILADRSAVIRREARIIHPLLIGLIVAVLVLVAVVLIEPPLRQIQRASESIESRNQELEAERESAETALARAASLRAAFQQNALMLLANAEGQIQEVDTPWADLLETNVAELLGEPIMAVCFPSLPSEEQRLLLEAVQRGDPLRRDTPIQSPRGETRWFEITIVAVTTASSGSRQFAAMGFEISSRIELTERLLEQVDLLEEQHTELVCRAEQMERSRAEAEQASRLKSEFLARTSHEIRTPMAAILGYADLLRDELTETIVAPPTIRHVETIRQNGQYLLNLVNDLLDLSKIEAGRLTMEILSCRPRKILDEVQSLLAVRAAEKSLRLELKVGSELSPRVLTDPLRFKQILLNLVGNAIKFTDTGGVLVMAEEHVRDDTHSNLVIRVCDTGIGMTNEVQQSLFRPYVQQDGNASRRVAGTGLGLWISKWLAEKLGGDIVVESQPGRGSTFTLTITVERCPEPVDGFSGTAIDDEVAPPAQEFCHVEAEQLLRGARILLVEDSPALQRLVALMLRRLGVDVKTASNGREALRCLCDDGRIDARLLADLPFDLMLTDMEMPDLDGFDLCRILRARGFDKPIIALTAHAMEGDAAACLEAGCDVYLTKPVNRERLVSACMRALTSSRHPAPPVR